MEHCDLLTEILKIEHTRFVGMYDMNFEKITDGYQADIIPYLSREEMQDSVRYDIRRWETYKMFQSQLGVAKYAMVNFENAILLTFSLKNNEYLRVSIDSDVDYKALIEKIQNTLIKENFVN
ncbi:MAG: hypothetical protein ACE5GR_03855 [Nitrosopumilus sp.]